MEIRSPGHGTAMAEYAATLRPARWAKGRHPAPVGKRIATKAYGNSVLSIGQFPHCTAAAMGKAGKGNGKTRKFPKNPQHFLFFSRHFLKISRHFPPKARHFPGQSPKAATGEPESTAGSPATCPDLRRRTPPELPVTDPRRHGTGRQRPAWPYFIQHKFPIARELRKCLPHFW